MDETGMTVALLNLAGRAGIGAGMLRGEAVVAVTDMDDYWAVHNSLGGVAAESILERSRRGWPRLLAGIGEAVFVGGDEFLILLPNVSLVEGGRLLSGLQEASEDRFTWGAVSWLQGMMASEAVRGAVADLEQAKRRRVN